MHSLGEPKNHITHREGFKQNLKSEARQIFRWFYRQKSDVFFLQETYSSTQTINLWESESGVEKFLLATVPITAEAK